MFSIENRHLKINIHPKGAELQSIYHKDHKLEYMWNGDPAFWGKHSPLLFPIVGTLKEDTYTYQDKTYSLPRHGFARELEFEVEEQGPDAITLLLRSSAATKANYPFDFELRVTYQLAPQGLATTYSVRNVSDKDPLYFSIGGHPAFKVPLVAGTAYPDYFLEFEHKETSPRWPITKEGLIEKPPKPLLRSSRLLPLSKELFQDDAVVFKNLSSTTIALKSEKTERGLLFDFADFPYLGIWAAKNADFVCIEPWCGIADSIDSNQQLTDKEGINKLAPNDIFERTWTLAFS
ncbi:MAG TPA: aldose 1-epimerase family protein [Puia sp.]